MSHPNGNHRGCWTYSKKGEDQGDSPSVSPLSCCLPVSGKGDLPQGGSGYQTSSLKNRAVSWSTREAESLGGKIQSRCQCPRVIEVEKAKINGDLVRREWEFGPQTGIRRRREGGQQGYILYIVRKPWVVESSSQRMKLQGTRCDQSVLCFKKVKESKV